MVTQHLAVVSDAYLTEPNNLCDDTSAPKDLPGFPWDPIALPACCVRSRWWTVDFNFGHPAYGLSLCNGRLHWPKYVGFSNTERCLSINCFMYTWTNKHNSRCSPQAHTQSARRVQYSHYQPTWHIVCAVLVNLQSSFLNLLPVLVGGSRWRIIHKSYWIVLFYKGTNGNTDMQLKPIRWFVQASHRPQL